MQQLTYICPNAEAWKELSAAIGSTLPGRCRRSGGRRICRWCIRDTTPIPEPAVMRQLEQSNAYLDAADLAFADAPHKKPALSGPPAASPGSGRQS